MKLWKPLCGLAGLGALFALTVHAANQPCTAGCGLQNRNCLQTARVTKLACKADCRANANPGDLGACSRACTDAFRTAKDTCRTDHRGCVSACQSGSPDGAFTGDACAGDCGQTLASCAQTVISAGRVCVQECRTASDRLSCLQNCAATAHAGGAQCGSDFSSCLAGC
jgi:hypothetical protein